MIDIDKLLIAEHHFFPPHIMTYVVSDGIRRIYIFGPSFDTK